jgi:hypothetical protein
MIMNGSIFPNSLAFTWMRIKMHLQTMKTTLGTG